MTAEIDRSLASHWLEQVRPPAYSIPADLVGGSVGRWVEVVRLDRLRQAVAGSGWHDCATCEDCLHDGHKCCGCYDGACCQRVADIAACAGCGMGTRTCFLGGGWCCGTCEESGGMSHESSHEGSAS